MAKLLREAMPGLPLAFDEADRDELALLWGRRDYDGMLRLFNTLGVAALGIYRASIQENPQDAERDAEPYVLAVLDAPD